MSERVKQLKIWMVQKKYKYSSESWVLTEANWFSLKSEAHAYIAGLRQAPYEFRVIRYIPVYLAEEAPCKTK
jgi:hypothetical protein